MCHIYVRHVSRQLASKQRETAYKFMVRLCKQYAGRALRENLRDQIIEKLCDVELKNTQLKVNNITLEAAKGKVRNR